MASPGGKSEFELGEKAGQVDAELHAHSEHLAKINGSQAQTVIALSGIKDELHEMSKEMAAIRQQAAADADTRVALAAALKEAEGARREKEKDTADALRVKSDETWQPYARALAVAAILLAAVSFAYTVLR